MGRNSNIAIAAILALAIASCSSEGDQQSSNLTSTNTPAATQPFNNPVVSANKKVTNQPFNNPVVSAKQTSPVASMTTANLIQPTNATERVGIVSKGRNDPFAEIVRPYSIGVTNPNVVARPVPKLPPLSVPQRTQTTAISATRRNSLNQQKPRVNKTRIARSTVPKAIASVKGNANRRFNPVLPKVLPQVIASPALASVLPPPPQPELARTVFVSGVVLLNKEPQAIIKVPNEPTSRYVQAGQRLANGVLIKRIEMNEGSEPVVILEQYGMEVARMVGEGSATQTPSTAASGGNSVSLTVPPQNPIPGGAS
ncbi:hypothetical protein [Mastigocladopsis repens]|uniref:hypothetical protein n=1 Tax=Mastigocladopsis repens TaxID=221287 RepID=UPI00030D0B21|nr:hypothetical protein [Mastigocladopsis repens]